MRVQCETLNKTQYIVAAAPFYDVIIANTLRTSERSVDFKLGMKS